MNNFVGGAIYLLELAFLRQLPMRGCIGIGDVLVDNTRGIVLSSVMPTLVKAEKNQDWTGCFVIPEAEDLASNAILGPISTSPRVSRPILRFPVPFKDNLTSDNERLCRNWVHMLIWP